MNNQPLSQVMETTHLVVVLTDDISCTKDVEWAKLAFFKHFNSIYHKFSFVDKNVLLNLFRLRICGKNSYDSNHECLEQVTVPIFKHFLAKKQMQFTLRLLYSLGPYLGNHKYFFRQGCLFCKYITKLFSDNYQILDAIRSVLQYCELVMFKGMNRGLPDMPQVDCFILIVWPSIVLLSTFAVFSLITYSWRYIMMCE